jgi:hypothetical protein
MKEEMARTLNKQAARRNYRRKPYLAAAIVVNCIFQTLELKPFMFEIPFHIHALLKSLAVKVIMVKISMVEAIIKAAPETTMAEIAFKAFSETAMAEPLATKTAVTEPT